MRIVSIKLTSPRSISIIFLIALLFVAGEASAQTPSVMLMVNGQGSVTVSSGDTVVLQWAGTGVSDCTINNGVGPVAASGTQSVVVPEGGGSYTISCTGGSDTVILNPNLHVTLYPTATDIVTVGNNGRADVRMNWRAANATECNLFRAVGLSTATVRTLFSEPRDTAGSYSDSISESTRYEIRCVNTQTGKTRSAERTVTVVNGGQTEITHLTTSPNGSANYNPAWAGALVEVEYRASNANQCVRTAETALGETYQLAGWTGSWGNPSRYINFITLSRDTTLKVRCTKDNQSDEKQITIQITKPGNVTEVAAPTATLIAPSSVSVPVASDLPALVRVETQTTNAQICRYFAYDVAGNAVAVSGWTNRVSTWWDRNASFTIKLNQTTQLVVTCYRDSDGTSVSADRTVNVVVGSTATPRVTLAATPAGVNAVGLPRANLTWMSENVSTCYDPIRTFTGGTNTWFYGSLGLAGNHEVDVFAQTEYSITCRNAATNQVVTDSAVVSIGTDGQFINVDASVDVATQVDGELDSTDTQMELDVQEVMEDVTVNQTMTLRASPALVRRGETTNLIWQASEEVSLTSNCVIAGATETFGPLSGLGGQFQTSTIVAEQLYVLSCADASGSDEASIRVLPAMQET